MVLLKRAALAGLGLAVLMSCERDFSTPWLPTDPDSTATAKKVDTAKPNPWPVSILIESLSASDLRMQVGETKSAPVTVLPPNATSPLYEMSSNKPEVAEATPDGIRGVSKGSATITVNALDGSGKTTKFHVVVEAILDSCILIPCLCLGKVAGGGEGKGKGKEKAQEQDPSGCSD